MHHEADRGSSCVHCCHGKVSIVILSMPWSVYVYTMDFVTGLGSQQWVRLSAKVEGQSGRAL